MLYMFLAIASPAAGGSGMAGMGGTIQALHYPTLAFVFALILLAFHNHQGFHVITNSGGLHLGANTFLLAMFMSLFVIYGFDTASTLAEETRDPRRTAPRAVLYSIVGAFIIGGVFLLATLMAIPNLHAAIAGAYGPQTIIEANFSHPFVLTYPLNGYPTDIPRPQLTTTNLTGFTGNFLIPVLGTINDNQLWGADFGVLR